MSITNRLCGRKRNRLSSRQNSRYAACSSRFHAEHHHYCCTLRGGRRTVHCCGRHAASLRGARAGREWCRGRVVGPPWRARRPRSPGVPALPDLDPPGKSFMRTNRKRQCWGSVTFWCGSRTSDQWIRIQLRIRLLPSVTLRIQRKFFYIFF